MLDPRADPVAEMRRLYGDLIDARVKVDVPGMEIGTQHKYSSDMLIDMAPEASLLRPEAVELMRARRRPRSLERVHGRPGISAAGLLSEPIKIIRRRVPLSSCMNRQHASSGLRRRPRAPKEFEFPAFMGYSMGHWEGDVFVVETAGFNDKNPLDGRGHPRSEALRVTERFRRRDFGHMDVEMTFDDPKMYTRPFTVKVPHDLVPDADIFEMFCENEKDRDHLKRP